MAKDRNLKAETPEASTTGETEEQLLERIHQRAHELYLARGQDDGHDLEDWLQAEAEITASNNPAKEA